MAGHLSDLDLRTPDWMARRLQLETPALLQVRPALMFEVWSLVSDAA